LGFKLQIYSSLLFSLLYKKSLLFKTMICNRSINGNQANENSRDVSVRVKTKRRGRVDHR